MPIAALLLLVPASALAQSSQVHLPMPELPVQVKTTIPYVYVVGEEGMTDGDAIRVEDPLFQGMRWSKWGTPDLEPDQCTELETGQAASWSLVTASTGGDATLIVRRVDDRGEDTSKQDPHLRVFTEVEVLGSLAPGEEIELVFGDDMENALCGHETPDRAFRNVEWRTWERIGDGDWVMVETIPTFDVLAEDTVAHLHVVATSVVEVGEPVTLKVAPMDYLGNPVLTWRGTVTVLDRDGAVHTFTEDDAGFHDFLFTLDEPGIYRFRVSGGDLTSTSNPVEVVAEPPARRLYWGDLHTHHGNHFLDEAGDLVDESQVYGRDIAGIHIGAHTQKGLHTEIDGEELWEELAEVCRYYSVDGEYIVLQAWEWVGDYSDPANPTFYHHNIYYDDCNGPLGSHQGDVRTLDGESGLYAWVRQAAAEAGNRAVMGPHAPRFTGYDWDNKDFDLRRFVEVWSEWGNSMQPPSHAASVPSGLRAGNRFGFIAASDNHDGWLGNPFSSKNTFSGLGAFWAPALTKAAIFDALHDRNTYATTGHRPIMRFSAEDGGSVTEGQALMAETPVFHWSYHGTDTIQRIELVGVEVGGAPDMVRLAEESPGTLDRVGGSFTWDAWDGSTWAVWLQVEQTDGQLTWSTPIWVTTDCSLEELEDPAGRCGGPDDTGEPSDDTGETPSDPGDDGTPGRRSCFCGVGASPQGVGAWLAVATLGAAVRRRRSG